MTFSSAFTADVAAAELGGSHGTGVDSPRVHTRIRAQGTSVPTVDESVTPDITVSDDVGVEKEPLVDRIGDWFGDRFATFGEDFRTAWFLPASLPTLTRAWCEAVPDRSRVPGDSSLLFWSWAIYNHVALIVPLAALVIVGLLTPAVWIVRHPARLALTVLVAAPFVATTVALG